MNFRGCTFGEEASMSCRWSLCAIIGNSYHCGLLNRNASHRNLTFVACLSVSRHHHLLPLPIHSQLDASFSCEVIHLHFHQTQSHRHPFSFSTKTNANRAYILAITLGEIPVLYSDGESNVWVLCKYSARISGLCAWHSIFSTIFHGIHLPRVMLANTASNSLSLPTKPYTSHLK